MKSLRFVFLLAALVSLSNVWAEDAPSGAIAPTQLQERIAHKDKSLVVLDVRTPEEFAAGHIAGARNIPHDQLPNRIAELMGDKDKDIVVYCRSGRRSAIAQEALESQGFKRVKHLEGDMLKWEADKRPISQ